MQTITPIKTSMAKNRDYSSAAEPVTMRKRIGSIVYEVEIRFNPDARETMSDKIFRLMRHDMEAAS